MDNLAMWVYFSIGGLTLLLLAVSFLVGEMGAWFDDVSSPVTDWLGDHLSFGHDGDGDFSGILNTGLLFGFMAGFGFTAAYLTAKGMGALPAGGFGILGGLVLGVVMALVYLTFRRAEGTSSYSLEDFVGKTMQVEESIPTGGQGRVRCTVNGVPYWHTAQTEDGSEIKVGASVRVTRVADGTLYVVSDEAGAWKTAGKIDDPDWPSRKPETPETR